MRENEFNLPTSEYSAQIKTDEIVRGLDPLRLDSFMMQELPKLNKEQNVWEIINKTRRVTSSPELFKIFSVDAALAATRDLGIIVASLARHGVDLESTPTLERSLIELSYLTGEVPRDTVFSYGPRNPQDDRMRTFTGTEAEKKFITSFVDGMKPLSFCIQNLMATLDVSILEPRFLELLTGAKIGLTEMVRAMVEVRRKISPEFFSDKLRPYFPPLTIGGKLYMAPGGAQMPLILIDRILWGVSTKNLIYQAYYEDNYQYLPVNYRKISKSIKNLSLVDKVVAEVESRRTNWTINEKSRAILSISVLQSLFSELQKFRVPHRKVAEENFQIRPENSVGSGGYTNHILDVLSLMTIQVKQRIAIAKQDLL